MMKTRIAIEPVSPKVLIFFIITCLSPLAKVNKVADPTHLLGYRTRWAVDSNLQTVIKNGQHFKLPWTLSVNTHSQVYTEARSSLQGLQCQQIQKQPSYKSLPLQAEIFLIRYNRNQNNCSKYSNSPHVRTFHC